MKKFLAFLVTFCMTSMFFCGVILYHEKVYVAFTSCVFSGIILYLYLLATTPDTEEKKEEEKIEEEKTEMEYG